MSEQDKYHGTKTISGPPGLQCFFSHIVLVAFNVVFVLPEVVLDLCVSSGLEIVLERSSILFSLGLARVSLLVCSLLICWGALGWLLRGCV